MLIQGMVDGRQDTAYPGVVGNIVMLIKRHVKVYTDKNLLLPDINVFDILHAFTP